MLPENFSDPQEPDAELATFIAQLTANVPVGALPGIGYIPRHDHLLHDCGQYAGELCNHFLPTIARAVAWLYSNRPGISFVPVCGGQRVELCYDQVEFVGAVTGIIQDLQAHDNYIFTGIPDVLVPVFSTR